MRLALSLLASLWLLGASGSAASQREPRPDTPPKVGVHHAPPFASKAADGSWSGLGIELWEHCAARLALEYELVELPFPKLLAGLEHGELDVVISPLTINAERERRFDFTHAWFNTGLAVAIPARSHTPWRLFVRRFPWSTLARLMLALLLVLALGGALVWLFERQRNPQHFSPGWRGLGEGFWWSAVTMTTVGYGDRAPVTFWGRLIAVLWMFSSLFLISAFTASVAATMTAAHLGAPLTTVDQLRTARVGTLEDSHAAYWLERQRLGFTAYPSIVSALSDLRDGELDAVVGDAPVLSYHILHEIGGGLELLPELLEPERYGFGLPHGSPLREPLGRELLSQIESQRWHDSVERYTGQ